MKRSIALFAVASALALPAGVSFAQTAPANPQAPTSDRTPDAKTKTPLSQSDHNAAGQTSDRTPERHTGTGVGAGSGSMNLTQAECQSVWKQADAKAAGSISQQQAQPYVSDFKRVDADGNGQISSAEFLKGCQGGMVNGSASTGSAAGDAGSSSSAPSADDMPERK